MFKQPKIENDNSWLDQLYASDIEPNTTKTRPVEKKKLGCDVKYYRSSKMVV